MDVLFYGLMVVGGIGSIVCSIWFLFEAFKENVLWGLGSMFVPFVSFFFVVMHWDKAGRPFMFKLASLVPLFLGAFLSGSFDA